LLVDPNSLEGIEKKFERRAEEINDRVRRFEESQKVTQETMNLEFTI